MFVFNLQNFSSYSEYIKFTFVNLVNFKEKLSIYKIKIVVELIFIVSVLNFGIIIHLENFYFLCGLIYSLTIDWNN